MSQPPAAHVPTLTEVIELLAPMPMQPEALQPPETPHSPVSEPPPPAPIVTPGLAPQDGPPNTWTPMGTVVLPAEAPPTLIPERVPVLSAVVTELPERVPAPPADEPPAAVPPSATLPQTAQPELNEAQLAQRVMGVVQKQVDGMLDFRLREAMAPVLARHSEALLQDLREELRRTMCDVVNRAVAQEMAKLRQR